MLKILLFLTICVSFLLSIACSDSTANSANANANGMTNVDPKNMPPEFSTQPVPPGGSSTPGIDPNAANATTDGKPIPGIDPKNANRPIKPGGTPTPGIDPEAARRQMKQPPGNLKGPPPLTGDEQPAPQKKPRPSVTP